MRSIPPSRRVAAAYGVAHLALRTPFYVQNHDARSASTVVRRGPPRPCHDRGRATSACEHWSAGVVLFSSRVHFGLVYFGAVVADSPSPLSTPRSATGQAQLRLGKPLRMKFRDTCPRPTPAKKGIPDRPGRHAHRRLGVRSAATDSIGLGPRKCQKPAGEHGRTPRT